MTCRIGKDKMRRFLALLMRFILLGLGSALAIGGCASLSQEECLNADWYDIGARDGAEGYPANRWADHRRSCSEYRIQPDWEAYRAGWEEGINNYCTPERGFQEGRKGAGYAKVCPPQRERAFLREYRIGQEMYEQERRIEELEREQERRESERRQREEHSHSENRRDESERTERLDNSRWRDIQPVGPPIRIEPPEHLEQPTRPRPRDVPLIERSMRLQPQPRLPNTPEQPINREKKREEAQKPKEELVPLRKPMAPIESIE